MTTDKQTAAAETEKKTKSVWEQIEPGKQGTITLTFGNAAGVTGMDRNSEAQLIQNCIQAIAGGLIKKNEEFIPIEGRLELTPQNTLMGALVVYRRTPEQIAEVKKAAAAQKPAGPAPG
jgi:hypothetical protein